jgi:hypothetical protein
MRDLKDVLEPLGRLHPIDRWSELSERPSRRPPPEPPRPRTGVYALAVGALALLVAIAIVLAPLGGRREKEPAGAGEAPPAWLVERAYGFAYASGDITPTTAEWTFAGMDVIGPAVGVEDGDPTVREYLVLLHGDFTGYWAKVPPGADLPEGDRLAFAVDPETHQVTDSSIGRLPLLTAVPGLRPFELPPASAAVTSRQGWTVTAPPGWQHGSFITSFGPDGLDGTWIANRPASSLSKAAGGASTPAQFSADGFARDAIALVIVRSDSPSRSSDGTVLTPPLALDEFGAGSSLGGSALELAWITDGEHIFSVTIRTGDAATAVDRAAMADVIASLRFDVAASARGIPVGPLPQVGIVVSDGDGAALLDTDGNLLASLPGYHLTGNPGAPGVWLESGARPFMLDPAAGVLVPVARETAAASMYDEGPEPDLASPANATVGHWRFQLFPSVGTASLAQWSGECEAPTAYWVDADGSERIITGERSLAHAPESVALGWTPDGAALVFLPAGSCASRTEQPGVYRYTAPGEGELVYATRHDASAEMWDVP